MGQHRGSGRGPHTIEHASHMDAADLAQAVAIRRDRLVARQLAPYQWSPSRADEVHTLGEAHRLLAGFIERRHAGEIPDGTPAELALAGAAVVDADEHGDGAPAGRCLVATRRCGGHVAFLGGRAQGGRCVRWGKNGRGIGHSSGSP